MPIYEYKCEGCGEVFEIIQKFADQPLTVHEKCGGHVNRLMSAPAFQFKGTGWYVTDYAKGSGSGPPKHDSGKNDSEKTDSASKKSETTTAATETKTESKPAASNEKS